MSVGCVPDTVRILTVDEAGREAINPAEPLIIRGAFDRARPKWNEAWLKEFMGQTPCSVSLDSRPAHRANKKQRLMGDYLEQQWRGTAAGDVSADEANVEYLFHAERSPAKAAQLLAELDLPGGILQAGPARIYQVYVGPPCSGTLPHAHTFAINALARGRKRWAIYVGKVEADTQALWQESLRDYGSGARAIPWFAIECPKLRSRGIQLWEGVQEPGDVVCIPAFYLHAAMNLEPVIGFTVEFGRSQIAETEGPASGERLSALCMSGPYMEKGARRLSPYIEKYGAGKDVLELGPNRHPLVTPATCDGRIVYLEASNPCIDFLREQFGDAVAIVTFDLNGAWDGADNLLRRHLADVLHRAPYFDSLVVSQVLNHVDYRALLRACAELVRAGGLLFLNNIMNYGGRMLMHPRRPKGMEELLASAAQIGFDPVEVVAEPAGVANPHEIRHLAVLRRRA
jgi:hypothetical protein